MKISWLIIFLFTICIESTFTPAYASYAPHYETTDVAKSIEDGFLVRLSRSNYHYDNIGMLYYCDAKLKQPQNADFRFLASVVYIGDGMCLTAAHTHTKLFDMTNRNSAVCFEINRKRTPFYHVVEYFIHPDYEKNYHFDIAVLVLNRPVDGLTGLEPCYDFSQHRKFYKDNLHLLTYIGYGAKLLWNDWFCFSDKQRRAIQAYTHSCEADPNVLGIYSTPYGNSNDFKQQRPLFPYEAKGRAEFSGGAGIHPQHGLVSIISGGVELPEKITITTDVYRLFATIVNIFLDQIKYFLFNVPLFNTTVVTDSYRIQSVPLGPVKDWLEDIRIKKRDTFSVM